jgi:RimJ/RimL family protein N-acetyltransferase
MIFRPYREKDSESVLNWVDGEQAFYKWSGGLMGDYPLDASAMNEYYKKQAEEGSFMAFAACDETGQLVGQLFMKYTDLAAKKVRFGFAILDPKARGKGFGRKMMEMACRYAFDFLQADEILLGAFVNNEKALRCYKSAGFAETGETSEYRVKGKAWQCTELINKRRA